MAIYMVRAFILLNFIIQGYYEQTSMLLTSTAVYVT